MKLQLDRFNEKLPCKLSLINFIHLSSLLLVSKDKAIKMTIHVHIIYNTIFIKISISNLVLIY